MNKSNIDWKLIIATNSYNSIFIKSSKEQNCLSILYKNIDEISSVDEFSILLPTLIEIDNKDSSHYLKKFAPLLKDFFEDKTKKTIITEEDVLNILLKQDKRNNFFRFLAKQRKNIVLFCKSDYERYVVDINQPYRHSILDYDEWIQRTELFNRFKDIKIAISKTYNPFKDPVSAFKKYSEEI